MNTTPHTFVFSHRITCTRMAQVWVRTHSISCFMCHLVCPSDLFDDSIFLSFLTIFSLITLSFLLPVNFIFQGCGGQIPCALPPMRTLAPLPSTTLSQVMSPKTTTSREAYEHYTQESLVEQRSPNDFDYDDFTICKALSDACRRRADHYQEEGLSCCLSSSVSHDRTVRPVVKPIDSQVSTVQEIQRHSSESEQIMILLERQREQILADSKAEIRKHESQAGYDRRSIQRLK